MNKIINKKVITIFLCIILSAMFLLTGCKKKQNEETPPVELSDSIDVNTGEQLYLFKNNSSNYKVLIPKNATKYETYAADELIGFFKEATGYTLLLMTDEGVSFDEKAYYLSIGATTVLSGSGVTVSSLPDDGFKLATKGNTVIMAGYNGYGTLYAAYEFLNYQVGFEAYSVDEVHVDAVRESVVLDYDLTEIPDIRTRMSGNVSTRTVSDAKMAGRMRLLASIGGGQPIFGGGKFNMWVHSELEILCGNDIDVFDEYVEKGWTWASDSYKNGKKHGIHVGGICYTNDEMSEVYIANLLQKIDENPDAVYFHCSAMDTFGTCTEKGGADGKGCASCKASDLENGGAGGTMMVFTNKIADAVKAARPDREIVIVPLAYHGYQAAPANDDGNGNYTPVNDKVIAHENVMVMLAPIYKCVAHGIDDMTCNKDDGAIPFYGWSAISKRLAVYDYATHYGDSFLYLNNFSSTGYNYALYAKNGVEFLYPLGDVYNSRSSFSELRTYIDSKLMWDTSLNYEQLVEDFMHGYYKDAGEEMFDYYKAIRAHYDWITRVKGIEHFYVNNERGTRIYVSENWPEYKLLNLHSYLSAAFKKIEMSSRTADEKEALRIRILTEEVSIRHYLLSFYGKANYSAEKYEELYAEWFEDCKLSGYSHRSESAQL